MLALFRTKSLRCHAALAALCAFLFATLAVANYVCPDFAAPAATMTSTATMPADEAMPCDTVDTADPQLCIEHCQYAAKSVDTSSPLPLLPWVAILLLLYIAPGMAGHGQRRSASRSLPLAHRYGPPLFLRHCRLTQ